MTETKAPTVALWNLLFGVSSIAVLVGLGLLMFGLPIQAAGTPANPGSISKLIETGRKANDSSDEAHRAVAKQLWTESQATLGSSVLDTLSIAAEHRNVQVASFRSENPIEVAHLREAPFVAVVEGTYSDVAVLVQALENPKYRLTLNLLEISGAETGRGQVRATLGVVAFVPVEGS